MYLSFILEDFAEPGEGGLMPVNVHQCFPCAKNVRTRPRECVSVLSTRNFCWEGRGQLSSLNVFHLYLKCYTDGERGGNMDSLVNLGVAIFTLTAHTALIDCPAHTEDSRKLKSIP